MAEREGYTFSQSILHKNTIKSNYLVYIKLYSNYDMQNKLNSSTACQMG